MKFRHSFLIYHFSSEIHTQKKNIKRVKKRKNIIYFHFFFHSCNFTTPCFSSRRVSSLKLAPLLLLASGNSWKSRQFPTRASCLHEECSEIRKKWFEDNEVKDDVAQSFLWHNFSTIFYQRFAVLSLEKKASSHTKIITLWV